MLFLELKLFLHSSQDLWLFSLAQSIFKVKDRVIYDILGTDSLNCEITWGLTDVKASIYHWKSARQPFDTIHDIPRSLGLAQSRVKIHLFCASGKQPIWDCRKEPCDSGPGLSCIDIKRPNTAPLFRLIIYREINLLIICNFFVNPTLLQVLIRDTPEIAEYTVEQVGTLWEYLAARNTTSFRLGCNWR